jgi:hypothetical protein
MSGPSWKGAAPPQRDAGQSDPNIERLGGVLVVENIKGPADFQTLGHAAASVVEQLRFAHVVRRCRLDPAFARLVVDLAFPESRQ